MDEIKYSAIDTLDTKLLRIGYEMKCLSTFVRIVSEGNKVCTGTSLFEEVKDITEFSKELQRNIKAQYRNISNNDIAFAIISVNESKYKKSREGFINSMKIAAISYDEYKVMYETKLAIEMKSTQAFIDKSNLLENSKVPLTKFIKKESKFTAKITRFNDIESLFDNLAASSSIPFLVYTKLVNGVNQQVHKIFSDIKEVFSKWMIGQYEPGISFYYFLGGKQRKVDILKPQDYILCSITEKHDIDSNKKKITELFLTYEGQTKNPKISINIAKALNVNLSDPKEIDIGGSFEMKGKLIRFAFIDAIMNNDIISKYLSEFEFVNAIRQKIYFYCNIDQNRLTISITRDENYKFTLKNAVSDENVQKFMDLFSHLLGYYLTHLQDSIVADYKSYGVELKEDEIKTVKKTKNKEDNIYKDYAAKCTKERRAIIIDDMIELEDDNTFYINQNIGNYTDAVRFPKETITDGNDNYNPHWYACESDKHPHIGLTHIGGDRLYIPCCFESLQNTGGSSLDKYLNDEEYEDEDKQTTTYFVKTQTMIFGTTRGMMPQKISIIFNKHERIGVCSISERKLSFLSAISKALELKQTGQDMLEDLYENSNFNLCRQAFPNLNETEIKEHFKRIGDENLHLDAREIISLVEEYYKCNIYVLSRDLGTDVPYPMNYKYKELDLKYKKRFGRCIFVYENPGTIANHDKYGTNNYELIIVKEKNTMVFKNTNRYVKAYRKLVHIYKSQYVCGKKVKLYSQKKIKNLLNPIKQGFDLNGKVRQLLCNFDEGTVLIETNPLPPLDLPVFEIGDLLECVFVIPQKIQETQEIQKDNNFFCEVNMKIVEYKQAEREYLNIFMKNSKITRFIKEYLFHGFSSYINKNNTSPNNYSIAIDNFINNNLIVTNGVQNNLHTSNTFDDGTYRDGDNIYIPSEDIKKSCSYLLKWMVRFEPDMLRDYHNYTALRTYYQNISDYKQYPNTVVFLDNETIKTYFSRRDTSILYRGLEEKKNEGDVYYMKYYDEKNTPKIFIVYAADSMEKAYIVYDTWITYNFLLTPDELKERAIEDVDIKNKIRIITVDKKQETPFKVFDMGAKNIKISSQEDHDGEDPIIMIYKFVHQNFFYVLLPVD